VGSAMKRRDFLKGTTAVVAGTAAEMFQGRQAFAQGGVDTLVYIREYGPNSFDIQSPIVNRAVYELSWNTYDRLITYGVKKDKNGNDMYAKGKFEPELALEWDVGPKSATFKLRRDATFYDGTPVTAHDVKWSFDRMAHMPGPAKTSLDFLSLTNADQFVAVDDYTFRIDYDRLDKQLLPVVACPLSPIMNSRLAKKNATANDPWAQVWLKSNMAGGGAYTVTSPLGEQQVVFVRNDKWKSGALPKIKRVVERVIPEVATRRAVLERGDADMVVDLTPKDISEMVRESRIKTVSTPMQTSVCYLSMQTKMAPFDNLKVRQAIAYAIPYQRIMEVALFNHGRPLLGATGDVTTPAWPQPTQYRTDVAKAKQLLTEAGFPNGFETTLSFNLGTSVRDEPTCVLIQESLAQIGIKVTLNKIAGSNWFSSFSSKKLPFLLNNYGCWYDYPEVYFYWAYDGARNELFNTASYQNPAVDRLIDDARIQTNAVKYHQDVIDFIKIAFHDVPVVPIYQPLFDVAMQKNITGYRYWFFFQVDFRPLIKAEA
jgi:peptide/nickel transport system substrate-binding protein